MSTFICEKCGCIDNTACGGTYWTTLSRGKSEHKSFKDDFFNEHPVCVACKPASYYDNSKDLNAGKWHGRFERKHWSEYFNSIEEMAESQNEKVGDMVNARIYALQLKKGELQESTTKSW